MKHFTRIVALIVATTAVAACAQRPRTVNPAGGPAARTTAIDSTRSDAAMADRIVRTDAEWKEELTSEQYRVLRKGGTEPAFSGKYWDEHHRGLYRCAACGEPLFSSDTKYDSGSGWPSFYQPVDPDDVTLKTDRSLGMARTEVLCAAAAATWATCSTTAPDPPGSATASTRRRSAWIPPGPRPRTRRGKGRGTPPDRRPRATPGRTAREGGVAAPNPLFSNQLRGPAAPRRQDPWRSA